jgi:hypothetical protein
MLRTLRIFKKKLISEVFKFYSEKTPSRLQKTDLNNKQSHQFHPGISEEFFYKNIQDPSNEKNILTLKEEEGEKIRSKLKLSDPISPPLVENETYREFYKNFSLYVADDMSQELDTIIHNEEKNGKFYKYGLPAKNELPFNQLVPKEDIEEPLPTTATESLFQLLGLDSDSSYESLILKIQSEFNHGITI